MHPILIAGAALVGLPILLHLIMKQEPKRLLFPALRFLKIKQKTNQRKMRLRHFILLALRMLIIALFCLTLYQPTLFSSALNLASEQPVAVVIILDDSPSMGYKVAGVSRWDEAKRRANEFLDDLPERSKVAVLTGTDATSTWELSLADARTRLESLKEPATVARPNTAILANAYQLLRTVDEETGEGQQPFPKILAIFTDRTSNSWDASRIEDLAKLRDTIPEPKPAQLLVDVGTDEPTNVAIVAAEIQPQILPANTDAIVTVTLRADGADVPSTEITATLDDNPNPERKEIAIAAGSQKAASFTFKDLKPGFHQVVFRIREDNLLFDNERTITFAVAEKRKILTIADDPIEAEFWKLSHNYGKQEFDCTVVTPTQVKDVSEYESITLLSVADPSQPAADGKPLWDTLRAYVLAGGKLFIAPAGLDQGVQVTAYEQASDLMPGKLSKIRDTQTDFANDENRKFGVTWRISDDSDLRHPMLAPFREWKLRGNVDILRNPRRVRRYWQVEKYDDATTIVNYNDNDDPAQCTPAMLERSVGKSGKVVLLTTRLDLQDDDVTAWNDYWKLTNSWGTVFPNLVMRYLVGNPDEAVFNYPTGQDVIVKLPMPKVDEKRSIRLEGPGISGEDAKPTVAEQQTDLRIDRQLLQRPGEYRVYAEGNPWEELFSMAIPAEESVLDQIPEDAVTPLLGENSVIPLDKDLKLRDVLTTKFDQPVDLFPWLLIAVLFLFALEGVIANRFYKTRVMG